MNMLQELAARTGAAGWVIASMALFIAAWVAIAVWVFRARPEDLEDRARLALEGEGEAEDRQESPPATRTKR